METIGSACLIKDGKIKRFAFILGVKTYALTHVASLLRLGLLNGSIFSTRLLYVDNCTRRVAYSVSTDRAPEANIKVFDITYVQVKFSRTQSHYLRF